MRWRLLSCTLVVVACHAHGADIGGWMEHKSRADLLIDECPEIVALASQTAQALLGVPPARVRREAEGAAALYYASGMCYLVSDKVGRDSVAASAWLTRAAELEHPLARRALLSLRDAGTLPHAAGYHCHELGLGRRLCHGGTATQ
jgi:hypothetical protein